MSLTMSDSPASTSSAASAFRPETAVVDESGLLARAIAGDSNAFNDLVTIHQHRTARLVQRLLGWPDDVEDVVQEVFVDVLRNLSRFDGRSTLLTWMTRITINRSRTHQRRQWLQRAVLQRFQQRLPVKASPTPHDSLAAQETVQEVRTAIRGLKPRDREILVLRYLEELPIEEIAKTLNLSRGAVDVRLTRARTRLENVLKLPSLLPSVS